MTAMTLPISELSQADPEWLTRTLTASGYLTQGRVTHVIRDEWKRTIFSVIARLRIGYSPDARCKDDTAPPTTMILKFLQPGGAGKYFPLYASREFTFYRSIVPRMEHNPSVRCYDAAFDRTSRGYHFLLEDTSATHTHNRNPVPPSMPDCVQIMDCLARFHAAWWNDGRLGTDIGKPFLKEQCSKRANSITRRTHRLLAFLGDRISRSRHKVLLDLCEVYPQLLQRQAAGSLTIAHGDAHGENFLLAPGRADCRIIDWALWEVGPGADDLAYLMAVQWFAKRRQQLEQGLLRRYHHTLTSAGVENYRWEKCWNEYQLSVIKLISRPIYEWANNVVPEIWWNNLERILTAYEDLGCAEIMVQLKASRGS